MLAVGWDLSGPVSQNNYGGPFHTTPSQTKLGFLTAWQLGSKRASFQKSQVKDPGEIYLTFADLASEVHCLQVSH